MVMPRPRTVAFHNHSMAFVMVSGEDSTVVEGALRDWVQLRKESDVDMLLDSLKCIPYFLPILPKT